MEVDERPVALAPLEFADLLERQMALHRPDPAALRQDDGDRLLLDHRRPVDLARRRHLLDAGPPVVAELVLERLEIPLEAPPLPPRLGDQLLELLALLGQRRPLFTDLHLLKATQLPQSHVEDGFGLA